MRRLSRSRWWVLLAGMLLALGPAAAGTITVQWDPVSDTDLAGYRVYYGPTAGSHANQLDAGKSTTATIGNAPDCALTYVAVRAYDSGGLESTADSNSVKGFPRPVVTAVTPNSIKQGETKTFTVTGTNFDAGVAGDATRPSARVKTSNSGLTITSTKVDACGQITVTIQAASGAALGYATLYVENPDLTYSDPANHPWPYGQLANAINVTSGATDTTPPTVSSTNPGSGVTDVPVTVKPTITFSEAMLASSITSSTVKLLDSAGAAVTQASGSPTLSSDGRTATITPAANLKNSATYKIQAIGGSSGVKDVAGNPMASTWTQGAGFTTVAASDTTPPTVSSTNPAQGATGIAVTVKPTVTFSEAMMASTITATNVKLIDAAGTAIAQAAGSPALSTDGKTATITPAASLAYSTTYRIQVLGGSSGVKDLAGNAMASTYTQSPGFTTGAASNAPTKVDSTDPAAGQRNVPVSTKTFRITYNNDISTLWSTLTRAELQKSFRVTRLGRALKQTATSPAIENGGKTVAITVATGLLSGATYRTEAGPIPSAGLTALRNKGIDPGVLAYFWATSPGWTTKSSLSAAYSRDTATATSTAKALTIPENPNTLPPENTDQAVTSEFLVEFDKVVATSRLGGGIFRIVDEKGAEIVLKSKPRTENGGKTVVLTPAAKLDAGRKYKVVVRTGPSGVGFVEPDGSISTLSVPAVIPVATRVSGESTEPGVAP